MTDTLSNIQSAVYNRLRADLASPGVSDIDLGANSIQTWTNEVSPRVSEMLRGKPEHLLGLQTSSSLLITGNIAILPSDFHFVQDGGLRIVTAGGSTYGVREIAYDAKRFFQLDGSNFLLTPQTKEPVALIATGYIWFKPETGFASCLLTYTKYHPTISSVQNTLWSDLADKILIELVAAKYYEYQANSAEPEIWLGLQAQALNNARELAYGLSGQRDTK